MLHAGQLVGYLVGMQFDFHTLLASLADVDFAAIFLGQLDQIAIAVFGAGAAWLSQARTFRMRRWACVFGILAQPGFFWASWRTGQWGVFLLTTIYAGAWVRGVWTHWIRPDPSDRLEGEQVNAGS